MKTTETPSLRKFCLLLLMLLSYTDTYVLAAPKGGQVVSGAATIQQNGNLTLITAGNRSIINYGSFNIAAGETVRFVQPGANSSVLNRVVGSASPTEIFGSLQANGHVVLANPYGIFFRNGSVINVGGLYAGAGNLSDADFTKGKIHFTDLAGDVRNDGIIAADNRIALMGANVINAGSLKAGTGMAMMVSGKDVFVGEKNGNIFVQANGKATAAGAPPAASGSVVNSGTVSAPRVLLGGGDIYSTAIANSGLIQGRSIAVNAGRNGTALVGGTLDVSSANHRTATGLGGSIQVLGGKVALQGAKLDANGANGGGSVRVGGDFHGAGTLAHATTTTVDAATSITADATGAAGNGGTVVLWSDSATQYAGSLSARGGATGGNGGTVEVSGADNLTYRGTADLRASAGTVGSLLLDPHNITVDTLGVPFVLPIAGNPITVGFADGGAGADITILAVNLVTALTTANVALNANNNITFAASVAPLTGTNNLTLQAGNSIILNANVQLTLGGAFQATFNSSAATAANRDAGAATFTMGDGSGITAPRGVTIIGGTFGAANNPSTVNANTGDVTLGNLTTTANNPITAANPIPRSGDILVTDNAAGAVGKNITVNGSLVTSGPAANGANANTSAGAVTLTTGGAVVVNAVTATGVGTGAAGAISLNGGTGLALNGAVAGLGLTTGAGPITFNDGSGVTTSGGGQRYNGNVALARTTNPAQTTLIDSNNGNLFFSGTVNGSGAQAQALTLTTGGVQTFTGAVGGSTALATLTTGVGRAEIDGGAVTTSAAGGQRYNGPVALGAAAAATTLTATGGDIFFTGPVRTAAGAAAQALTVNATTAANRVTYGGAVGVDPTPGGTSNALASLNVSGPATINLNGGSATSGAVTTNGAVGQNYAGPVVLGAPTILSANGGGPITFGSTVTGAQDLQANASGLLTFNNTVGTAMTPLNSLLASGTGGTRIAGGGSIITSGQQGYNGNLSLGLGTVLLSTGGTVSAGSLTGNNFDLTVNATGSSFGAITSGGNLNFSDGTGLATFSGTVNAVTLNSTGSGGAAITGGGSVITSGLQNYTGALSLGLDTTLSSNGDAVSAGSLTGNNHDLSVTAANSTFGTVTGGRDLTFAIGGGTAAFTGAVNARSLRRTGTGLTTLSGNVTTNSATAGQSYGGAVTINNTLTLADTAAGPINIVGATDGATNGGQGLTVNTTGSTAFGGAVGGTPAGNTALASLTTNLGGTTTLNGTTVTTTGVQTYGDDVTLGAATATFASTNNGAISFNRAVSGTGTALAVNTGGQTTFGGAVGTLASLTTDGVGTGATAINGGSVTTTGAQTYGDAVTLGRMLVGAAPTAPTTLTAGPGATGGISFAKTLDGNTAGTQALTLATAGTQTFGGVVGTTALASLTTGTGEADVNGGAVTTTSLQTYTGPLVLGKTSTLTTTTAAVDHAAGAVTFNGLINGGGFDLSTVTTSGDTIFNPNSGSVAASLVNNLTTTSGSGRAVFYSPAFTTANDQKYQEDVVVAQSLTKSLSLTSNTGSLLFGKTLNSTPGLPSDLTLNANGSATSSVVFSGLVGGTLPVATPTAANPTAANSATALNSLTVTSPSIQINGGLVNTASTNPLGRANDGAQVYNGATTLGMNTTFVGSTVTVPAGSTIDAQNHDLTLTLASLVEVPLTGYSNVFSFTSNGLGGTDINGNFTTLGFQHYDNVTTLGTPALPNSPIVTLTAGVVTLQDSIRFGSTLDNSPASLVPNQLQLVTTSPGPITFGGAVGGIAELGTLQTLGGGTNNINGGLVRTASNQSYGGPAVLGAVGTLFGGQVGQTLLANDAGSAGQIVFTSSLDSRLNVPQALTTRADGNLVFKGPVGGNQRLASLDAQGPGTIDISGGLVRTGGNYGGQNYVGPVRINGSASVRDTLLVDDTAAGAIVGARNNNLTFRSTLDNYLTGTPTPSLTLSTVSDITLTGQVGGLGILGNFTATAGGTTFVNGGLVLSTGFQLYNSNLPLLGAVRLGNTVNPAVFTSTASGDIHFRATVDGTDPGAQALVVNTGGLTQFDGLVGSLAPLDSLTTDFANGANEQTQFNMTLGGAAQGVSVKNAVAVSDPALFNALGSTLAQPTVRTGVLGGAGSQSYLRATTLQRNTVLMDNTATPLAAGVGAITFGASNTATGTIDGASSLSVNTGGDEIFYGLIGGQTQLTGLQTDATGAPGGFARFNMNLAAPGTLAGVRVSGNVDLYDTAVFNAPGNTDPNNITLPTIQTGGAQTYRGAALVAQNTQLQSTASGPINFAGSLDGPQALRITTAGNTIFGAPVGNISRLTSLLTDGDGDTLMNGGFIGTTGLQVYRDRVFLGQDNTLVGGGTYFLNTLDNANLATPFNLQVLTGGVTEFDRVVGGIFPLGSLSTDADGETHLNGGAVYTVRNGTATTGNQSYGDLVILGANTLLQSASLGLAPAGGDIAFGKTVNGDTVNPARALTINTTGLTQFGGLVGNLVPLASLTTDNQFPVGGQTQFNMPLGNAAQGVRVINGVTINDAVLFNAAGSTPTKPTVLTGVNGGSGFQRYLQTATLKQDAVLMDMGVGSITFGATGTTTGTIDSIAGNTQYNLFATTGGDEIFYGLIGGQNPLASLQTDVAGTPGGFTRFNMNLALPNTVAGVRVSGLVDIRDNVVFNAPSNAGALPTVRTGGLQMYRGAATIAQNTILTSAGGGNLLFLSTVDSGATGARDLTLNSSAQTIFSSLVGNTAPLLSLTTDNQGAAGEGTQFNLPLNLFPQAAAGVQVVNGVTIKDPVVFNAPAGSSPARPTVLTGVNNGTGFQTYGATVRLTQDAIFSDRGVGSLTFQGAVDSTTAAAPRNLTLNTHGTTEFDGAVGAVVPLGSVFTDLGGQTRIKGGTVVTAATGATTGEQNYHDAVVLANNTTLTSRFAGTATTGGNLTFFNTVDGAFTLTLNTTGTTQFDRLVGSVAPLTALTTDAGTDNNQPVTVGGETVFGMNLADQDRAGVVVNGPVTINDAVRFSIGNASLNRPGILTLGNADQVYNGPARLGTNTFLTSAAALPAAATSPFTGGGGITFNDTTVGIVSVGGSDLHVSSGGGTTSLLANVNVGQLALGGAQATFRGPVNLPGLLSVLPNDPNAGQAVRLAGNIVTQGQQLYQVGVILGGDTTFTSLNALGDDASITFLGTVDSDATATARVLIVNTSGDEVFGGLVGHTGALSRLLTDAVGPVGGTARFNLSLANTPVGTAGVSVLHDVIINDAVRFNVAGSSLTNGDHPTIFSGGAQTYNGAATVARDAALVSGGGALTFNGTLDGPAGLAVSSAGDEVFNQLVGHGSSLASLATDTTGLVGGTARFNMNTLGAAVGVSVAGAVRVNDAVNFNADRVALNAPQLPTVLSGGAQAYLGAATLSRDTVLTAGSGDLAFRSTLDGAFGLVTNGTSLHVFSGVVGGTTPLTSLVTNGGGTQFTIDLTGLAAPAGVRVNGPLTVNGATLFNVLGGAKPGVLTAGAQTYNGAATLARDTALTSSGSGNVTFASTVDGAFNLVLNTAGLTTFNDAVGGTSPLTSLTTDADGGTVLNGGRVLTTGFQDYNDRVVLFEDNTLTSAGGGALHFHSTLDGNAAAPGTAFNLTLNGAGNEIFNGDIGAAAPLLSLTTDADPALRGGTTTFKGAGLLTVNTTGAQTYHDDIALQSPVALTTGVNGSVTAGPIRGAFDLTVNTGTATTGLLNAGAITFNVNGVTTLNGTVDGASLTVGPRNGALGQLLLNAGRVTTTGFQNYANPVKLLQDTLLDATKSSVTLSAPLNGGGGGLRSGFLLRVRATSARFGTISNIGDLSFTVTGDTTLGGTVNAASLSLNGAAKQGDSTLALNAGSVFTSGDQTYNVQKITLGLATNLAASNDGATISLGDLSGRQQDLALNATGAMFKTVSNVANLDVTAATTMLNGLGTDASPSVSTLGRQRYTGAVVLGADTALQSQGISTDADGNAISIQGTVTGNTGGNDLAFQVKALAGNVTLADKISRVGDTAFSVAGRTFLNGDVTARSFTAGGGQLVLNTGLIGTDGFQTYLEPVLLGSRASFDSDVTLMSQAGDIAFANAVGVNASGVRGLMVATPGKVSFGAPVGEAALPLASLRVTGSASAPGVAGGAETDTTFRNSAVYTTRQQIYDGRIFAGVDTAGATTTFHSNTDEIVFNRLITAPTGNFRVEAERILLHDNATVSVGNLTLNSGASLDQDPADLLPVLKLDGTAYTSGGTVSFNDLPNKNSPANLRYSTIYLMSPETVRITGQSFRMGFQQKLYAVGGLNISVNGAALVGDLAASTTINVRAQEVDLQNRPGQTENTLGSDSGLTFAAGRSISFGGARIEYKGDPRFQTANFVTTTGLTTIQRRTGLSLFRNPDLLTQFRQAQGGNARLFAERDAFNYLSFDIPQQPIGGGSQTLDTAAAISGALPDQKPLDIPVDVTITASQMTELAALGISARKAQTSERVSSRRALFAQLADGTDKENYGRLQPINGGVSRLVPSDYIVVVDRMSEREVQAILQAFEALYGKKKENAPVIGAAYEAAFTDYQKELDASTAGQGTPDAAGFSGHLKAKPGRYPEVDKAARGFDNLFGYIEHMGLTPVEVRKAETFIISDLKVSGIPPEDMTTVVNSQRKGLPPEQRAPSTKVPPAPPMSNPPPPAAQPKKTAPLKTVRQGKNGSDRRTARASKPAPTADPRADLAGL